MRTGVEIYRGMSGPLRTGVENYDICAEQYAWESRKSEVQFACKHRTGDIEGYVCSDAHGSQEILHLPTGNVRGS